MKILSAEEIRLWDQYTIEYEPISSINLMERAAGKCIDWLLQQYPGRESFCIFCGKGNNGGDGLAIARILLEQNYPVTVFIQIRLLPDLIQMELLIFKSTWQDCMSTPGLLFILYNQQKIFHHFFRGKLSLMHYSVQV